jgi:hypothetical protein
VGQLSRARADGEEIEVADVVHRHAHQGDVLLNGGGWTRETGCALLSRLPVINLVVAGDGEGVDLVTEPVTS